MLAALSLAPGCIDPKSPAAVAERRPSFHTPAWSLPASPEFHGKVLAVQAFDATACRPCHGAQYDGGLVGVSCRACHASYPHPAGWAEGHAESLQDTGWALRACSACHGTNYDVVKVRNSCRTCHLQPAGPEACNTCHGNFGGDGSNPADVAPPAGVDGETDPATPAVGAHQAHLAQPGQAPFATCAECHVVPATLEAAGHIDTDGHAEIRFGVRTTTPTESGARQPLPAYDRSAETCSNTYCHGNWGLLQTASSYPFVYSGARMLGHNAAPGWTRPNTVFCGSCHALPPTGHDPAALSACAGCHEGVVDERGNIIDRTLHVNGRVNVFGMEYPMF